MATSAPKGTGCAAGWRRKNFASKSQGRDGVILILIIIIVIIVIIVITIIMVILIMKIITIIITIILMVVVTITRIIIQLVIVSRGSGRNCSTTLYLGILRVFRNLVLLRSSSFYTMLSARVFASRKICLELVSSVLNGSQRRLIQFGGGGG